MWRTFIPLVVFSSYIQAIATFESSIWQHCWAQKSNCVWRHVAPCCYMLGTENRTRAHAWGATLLHESGQMTTTSCNIHKCCIKKLTVFQIWTNNTQQLATCRNTSPQDGQTRARCCDQHFYVMLCWNIVVVLPGLYICNNVNSMNTLSLE